MLSNGYCELSKLVHCATTIVQIQLIFVFCCSLHWLHAIQPINMVDVTTVETKETICLSLRHICSAICVRFAIIMFREGTKKRRHY